MLYTKYMITLLATSIPAIVTSLDTVCSNQVADFKVVDTSAPPPIFTKLASTVNLSDFPSCTLNIEAVLQESSSSCHDDPPATKCVKFFWDDVEVRQEKSPPYLIYGNQGFTSNFYTRKPPLGTHALKACTYSDTTCTMNESGCKEMNVTILDCDSRPTTAPVDTCDGSGVNRVTGFELVDTESPYDPVITPFTTPPVIDLSVFPTCALNIYATVSENKCTPIKCVKLSLGGHVRNEKRTPYALYGNKDDFIRSRKPALLGAQTLNACTYTDDACRKGKSGCLEIDVFVKDCVNVTTTSAPTPSPIMTPVEEITVACKFLSISNMTTCRSMTTFDSQETGPFGPGLSGTIPTELGLLTQLTFLSLRGNALTGTIPTELGFLTHLTVLRLSFNHLLAGTIPTTLSMLSQLNNLELSFNQLTGPIPTTLGQLTNLAFLDMGSNELTGAIPYSLGMLTQLDTLDLNSNGLTGTIPTTLGELTQLSLLHLHNNQLTGIIPSILGNLTEARLLRLDTNQLTGTTPSFEQLTKINVLSLHFNSQLMGTLPISLCAENCLVSIFIDCANIECSCCFEEFTGVRCEDW